MDPSSETRAATGRSGAELVIAGLRYAVLICGAAFLVIYVGAALMRIGYPFELEWMEGGSVDHVRRILDGRAIYVAPTLEFVPYIYTPLYFYLSAAVALVTGLGFFPLRLVSLLASVGCFALIFLIVRRETRGWYGAALAACFFAATYRIGAGWFDIARVDSLFLFFMLATLYVVRFSASVKSAVIGGVLLWLTVMTKQTALPMALPMFAFLWLGSRRRAVYFAVTAGALVGLSSLALDLIHDGWYRYYLFFLPSRHPNVPFTISGFWYFELLRPAPVASLLGLGALGAMLRGEERLASIFYLMNGLTMCVISWISRLHVGGSENVLMPAYCAISIVFGLGVEKAIVLLKNQPARRGSLLAIGLYCACLLQWNLLRYNPARLVPDAEDKAAGYELIRRIESYPGDVLVPYHGYLARMAGKSGYAPGLALHVFLVEEDPRTIEFTGEVRGAIARKQFDAILHERWTYAEWFDEAMRGHYREAGHILSGIDFYTVSGGSTRPNFLYEPIRDELPEPNGE